MAEPLRARPNFGRGTLVVGLVLITVAGMLAAFGLAKLRHGPSAGTLIYAGSQGIYTHDLSSGEDTRLTSLPKNTLLAEPSPDGRFVAYATNKGSLSLYEVESKRRYQIAERATIPVGWSPDSKLVARELVGNGDVVLIDPSGGRRGLIRGGTSAQSLPVWISPSRFAMGDLQNPDASLLIDTGASEQPVVHAAFGVPLAVSPDGTELLYQRDHELRTGKIGPTTITPRKTLFKGDVTVAATSPQGFVAFAGKETSGKEGVWVLETNTKLKRVVAGKVDWLVFSRDGSTILYAQDGAIYAKPLRTSARPKRISRAGVKVLTVLSFRVVR